MPTSNFNQHFPDYEILGELGRSNARVLKARNRLNGQLVAIKHFAFNTDEDTIRRFQQESEIMTGVNHPNIVRVLEVHFDAELPYIVMELVEGGDVRSLLKQYTTLDVATIIRLGLQMADALKAIHDRGIIHRDIKPDNIMYRRLQSGELHFLLTDFGIAKLREQPRTQTGQSSMTYEYASPEQFHDPSGVTEATDFYSLGVVLYECLSGQVPFPIGALGIGTLSKRVENEPPPPFTTTNYLPATLQQVVSHLLQKQPQQRLMTCTILKRQLKKADLEWEDGEINPTPELRLSAPSVPAAPASVNFPVASEHSKSQAESLPTSNPPSQSKVITGIAIGFGIVGLVAIILLLYTYNPFKKPANSGAIDSTTLYQPDSTAVADSAMYDPDTGESMVTDSASTTDELPPTNAVEQFELARQSFAQKEYNKAFEWLQKSADYGYADAQARLGFMYEKGYGTNQNYTNALYWFKKAADQNNAFGQYSLGYMYEKGYAVSASETEAIRWYKLAAEQHESEAIDALKRLGQDVSAYEN